MLTVKYNMSYVKHDMSDYMMNSPNKCMPNRGSDLTVVISIIKCGFVHFES